MHLRTNCSCKATGVRLGRDRRLPVDLVPCRPGPQPRAGREPSSLAGISSFAFMGTNAHVVLAVQPQQQAGGPSPAAVEAINRSGGHAGQRLHLHHSSYWVAPTTHVLLQRATPSAGEPACNAAAPGNSNGNGTTSG